MLVVLLMTGIARAQFRGEQRIDVMSVPGATESDEPELTVAGNIFHAVWYEDTPGTNRDVFYSRSMDKGTTWSFPVRIDLDPGIGDQDDPVVLAQDNVVVIAWMDDRALATVDDVFARVSDDFGATFSAEIVISGPLFADGGDADRLKGAISLPYVHLIFEDNILAASGPEEDVYVASSGNSGSSFGNPQAVNHPPAGLGQADIDAPKVVAFGATTHVVWVDRRDPNADHVFYNRSLDGGVNFASVDTRLDPSAPSISDTDDTSITISGNNIYVSWLDERDDINGLVNKVYMNASVDNGTTWLGDQRVDSAALLANTSPSRISAVGTEFFVTWTDNRNDLIAGMRDVFLTGGSVEAGNIVLGSEQRMDIGSPPGVANNSRSRLAFEAGALFVIYQDSRKDPAGLNDTLFLRASLDGVTFGPELEVSPGLNGTDDAEEHNIAVSKQRDVVCFWADNRNGVGIPRNNDVYTNHARFRVKTVRAPTSPKLGNIINHFR